MDRRQTPDFNRIRVETRRNVYETEWHPEAIVATRHARCIEIKAIAAEYCERLLQQGLLNRTDFDRNLRYRLTNIVANPIIVEDKLRPPLVQYWDDFVQLCARCKVGISSPPEKS